MKLTKISAALGLTLSLVCAVAQAQTVMAFQDDNIDFARTATNAPKTSGVLVAGDVLVSVFEMPTFSVGGVPSIPAGFELTGLAITQIKSGTGTVADPYVFGAYTGGFNAISPVAIAGGAAGGGAIVGMWLNPTGDFDLRLDFADLLATNCTDFIQCMTQGSAGTLFQIDGFFGDLDAYWQGAATSAGGNNIGTIAGTGGSQDVAVFRGALQTSYNLLGPITYMDIPSGNFCPAGTGALDGCIAGPTFSGGISGGLGLNPALYADGAFARSDINAQKLLLNVPEPGALALAGLALLGLGATRRRRQ